MSVPKPLVALIGLMARVSVAGDWAVGRWRGRGDEIGVFTEERRQGCRWGLKDFDEQ